MKWEKSILSEIADNIQTGPFGSQLHQSDYSEIGIPVVMPKNLVNGNISEDGIARVDETHVGRLSRHIVQKGDILYSRRGDVGKCAYATSREAGWLCGTGCLRVTIDEKKANSKFIFYQLQKKETIGWVEKHAVGATMLNLNTSILSMVPIEMPDLATQERIVSVLAAYDDLIENNQKQIKLLEEAAQRLYKEWFVDLCFPGHENVKIVDGVPEGWEKKELCELGDIVTGKTPSTSVEHYYGNDIPFVTIPDMHGHVFPLKTDKSLSFDGANSQKSKYLPEKALMVSCIGTVGLVNIAVTKCQTNQQINSIMLFNEKDLYYLYQSMKSLAMLLDGIGSNGTTMTNVNKEKFSHIMILVPDRELMDKYFEFCEPLFNNILMCSKKVLSLQEARDRLLPKLMSGEIEV